MLDARVIVGSAPSCPAPSLDSSLAFRTLLLPTLSLACWQQVLLAVL